MGGRQGVATHLEVPVVLASPAIPPLPESGVVPPAGHKEPELQGLVPRGSWSPGQPTRLCARPLTKCTVHVLPPQPWAPGVGARCLVVLLWCLLIY